MFQNFTTKSDRDAGPGRLKRLKQEMKAEGVTRYLIPHADEHQNEYLPEYAERLAWLTGFTGSAGMAIATLDNGVVFVDGRYTLQAREQIHPDAFTLEDLVKSPTAKWLEENTGSEDTIGLDPWLTTISQFEAYEKAANKSGAKLKMTENLIDRIWTDQPDKPSGPVSLHPVKYAGEEASNKITRIQKEIVSAGADLAVLTDPASLAWLFNIRGSDLVHNPLALGFSVVPATGKPVIFIADEKLAHDVRTTIGKLVMLEPPAALEETLSEMSNDKKVLCDPNLVAFALSDVIGSSGGEIVKDRDPVVLPRAIKNESELEGARKAHLVDGVAMCRFLSWLDRQKPEDITEIDAARQLEAFRIDNANQFGTDLREISFDTISGHGPNGAIVHYRVTEDSNRQFENNTLYLCDSGGQYPEGTTDITRTVAIGEPPKSAVTNFTLVLKGHIAIATARFPEGTRGIDIDVLARHALWQNGKDYAHGTGHGIGSYLNVHEGPQSISKRGMEKLVPGMIISNEPGFYAEGEYGIRIENLVIVQEAEQIKGGNIETHAFETITLCPIDKRLIDCGMLSATEKEWLNTYHKRVKEKLSVHLKGEDLTWLENATSPL